MSPGSPPPPLLFDGPPVDLSRLARRVLWITVGFLVVLALADVIVNWQEVIDSEPAQELCNTADEQSIPTWFSASQFVLVGFAGLLAAWAVRRRGGEPTLRAGCLLVGFFFIFLGLDDATELHERLGTIFANMHGGEDAQTTYGWQLYVLPVYLVVGVVGLVLVGPGLQRRGLFGWFLVGGLLMAFAQGLDFLEGRDAFEPWAEETAEAWSLDKYDITHPILMLEELSEMFGVTCVGQAFLRLIARTLDSVRLSLVGPSRVRGS